MPTISNMLSGNYSLFNSYANAKKQNAAQDSISSLWSSYSKNSATSNSLTVLSGLSEIRSGVASVMSSYNEAKDTFYAEMDDTMSELGKSASKVKSYDFNVGENAITKTDSVDEDGKKITTTTYSDKMKDALKTVQSFVDDYNDSIKFFSDNSEVSARVGRMAQNFGDTTYRKANYESIGISVKSDGSLSVDEEKLAKTISSDPNKVSRILGKDGLAGKAESHISTANSQRSLLFPSAKSMLGDQLSTAALYTGGAYRNMTNYANIGNLINAMF